MSSNNYNPYNYPYQQSSAQQYSGYQTAPAANNASQPSRQYQQPGPAATTQAADYISYPAQNYASQSSSYSGGQNNSWTASNYGANRETTSRAAEVLHNMSNTNYAPNTNAAVSPSGFTAMNSATANSGRYSTGAVQAQQVQPPQHTHATHSAYGTSQAQPRSVNTNPAPVAAPSRGLPSPVKAAGYPPQRSQTIYNQQQQRSASPVQNAYTHKTTTPVNTTRNATTAASNQYNNYNSRQLPTIEATRNTQCAVVPASYSYAEPQVLAPVVQPTPTANISEQYSQNAVTVDPMAVYDPWPEYQRKQEALRAQKAVEDAARVEEERKAEDIRLEEERKEEEERTRLEEEERARNPVPVALLVSQPESKNAQVSKKAQKQQATVTEATSSNPEPPHDPAAKLEAEIRAMMAKMRELNSKDPALLARIWEEERRSKVPKSPTAQSKPVAQPAIAQSVRANIPQATDQRKTSAAKEAYNAASTRALPVAVAQPSVLKPQAQAITSSTRPAGNTIWPPEKKSQLANAAAIYLTAQNPGNHIDADKVLSMLDSNPSYIELCEQLENMGLKLDRAAFAKNLLTAVPDVNSASRQYAPKLRTNSAIAQRVQAPLAIPAKKVATPRAPNPQNPQNPSAAFPIDRRSFPPFPDNNASASHLPVPVAEMVPIKAELKPPGNKEEAARKRNFNDLIDLTLLDDDEDNQPPLKKPNVNSIYSSYDSPSPVLADMDINKGRPQVNNFPVPASVPQAAPVSAPAPQHAPSALRHTNLVLPLDKYKALRRSTYNIKTIARDVLLACGRHPDERQLNAHLDILRINLPQINSDADLSTIRWDLIDPGEPPKGYFKIGVQEAEAEDADDESTDDEHAGARAHPPAQAIGGEGATEARAQALPEASNPFKPKRRGRPPRHSFPSTSTTAETPRRVSSNANMSASAPRPSAASVGYSAFRSVTEHGSDGNPLPKKMGRPVGWRKAIHGSPTAQARPSAHGHTGPVVNRFVPSQPSTLRNVKTGKDEPIMVQSRSPSVVNKVPQYQSFKCKWQNCKAELHNLETLKKHVHKIHRKETLRGTLECLWGDCDREVTSMDQKTNMTIKKHTPFTFTEDSKWREHLDDKHFSPILWELGDGPVGGLSDAHDSEAYLSDAQGRQVTPRIIVDSTRNTSNQNALNRVNPSPISRGRGRPPKAYPTSDAQKHLTSQKKRLGGPGMDRGGATLVTEKRRRGFSDNDETEEEFVDAES